jgi:hypothetical protein
MTMRFIVAVLAATLLSAPALAADNYDKSEKTKAYDIRLRVPAAAMAIPALKTEIFARWKKDSTEIKEQSTSDLKEMPQYFHTYALDTPWRVTYESPRLLSLSANSFIDMGGAHPNAAFDSIVWDKQANKAVPFANLFAPGQAKAAFTAIAAAAKKTWIATVNKEAPDNPVDPSQADEGIAPDADHLGHYALTYAKGDTKANGIVLLYGAGETWAHVMGDFRLAIPTKVFAKYLAPEWAAEFR